MLKSISCLVETPKDAGETVEKLLAAGFLRNEITVLFAENENLKTASVAATKTREPERAGADHASVRSAGERKVYAFHRPGDWRLQRSNVL